MTRELSKKICDKCGIEPHYNCLNVPCLNFEGQTGICNISENTCNPLNCKNYEPDTNHRNWKESIKVYPDFGKPENFVKLCNFVRNLKIEIWNEYGDGLHLKNRKKNKSFEIDILNHILWELREPYIPQEYGNKFNTYQQKLKQSIRKAEWKYD